MTVEALSGIRSEGDGKAGITRVIKQAAQQSGLDFDLMLGVAKRESSLNAAAKAATSSASGLFQFIDQTWLGAVKEHGDELGLGEYARDIVRTEKGFTVADPDRKDEILNLRLKPAVAAKVAGKTLAAAKDRLSNALGREASGSEVYMAHFLGERGAIRMLSAGEAAAAADVDPRAAGANKPLFFDGARKLSVAEFKEKIALHLGQEPAATAAPAQAAPVYAGPYAPRYMPQVETYSPSSGFSTQGFQTLPPQLQAAVVEMQSEAFFSRDDDEASS